MYIRYFLMVLIGESLLSMPMLLKTPNFNNVTFNCVSYNDAFIRYQSTLQSSLLIYYIMSLPDYPKFNH